MLNTPHISFVPFPVSVPIHQLEFLKAPPKISVCFGVPFLRQAVIRPRVLQMMTLGPLGGNIRSVLGAALQLLIHSFKICGELLLCAMNGWGMGAKLPITGGDQEGADRLLAGGQLHKDFVNQTRFWSRAVWHPLQPIDAAFCDSSVPPEASHVVNCLAPVARRFLKLQIKVFVTFLFQQWLVIRLLFLKKVHSSSSLQFPFDFLVWQIAVLQIKTGLSLLHFPPSLFG